MRLYIRLIAFNAAGQIVDIVDSTLRGLFYFVPSFLRGGPKHIIAEFPEDRIKRFVWSVRLNDRHLFGRR